MMTRTPTLGDVIAAHAGHDVFEDAPMGEEAECILWCETCSITIWYMESNCAPDDT